MRCRTSFCPHGAIVASLVLLGVSSSPTEAAERRNTVLIGSSSFNQSFGRMIAADLERQGYEVTRRGVSSSGFARPDVEDMAKLAEKLPINAQTSAVFVYLGMNDAQALRLQPNEQRTPEEIWVRWNEDRWNEVYLQRARTFFDAICRRGAKSIIVLLPVDVDVERLQSRLPRVRQVLSDAAQGTTCAIAVSTAGDLGRFSTSGESRRMADGVHMSTEGAQRVWSRIRSQVLSLIRTRERLPPPPQPVQTAGGAPTATPTRNGDRRLQTP
jgi:hypothetical protein